MFKNLFKKKKKLETYRSMWGNTPLITFNTQGSLTEFIGGNTLKETPKDLRQDMKPVEVWEMLKTEKPNIDCVDLNQKIKSVKERIQVIKQHMRDIPNDEYEVLGYLQARKRYKKNEGFFQWPITTNELINTLCKQYTLKIARFEEWYTLIPEEGIQELGKFRAACQKIRDEKPVIRLIVPDKAEEKKERKRDPILLASSPFGRWDYILGAWDKEVAIVDDFIYNGK